MEFLRSFLIRHLAWKPVVVSPNVGCFLRLLRLHFQYARAYWSVGDARPRKLWPSTSIWPAFVCSYTSNFSFFASGPFVYKAVSVKATPFFGLGARDFLCRSQRQLTQVAAYIALHLKLLYLKNLIFDNSFHLRMHIFSRTTLSSLLPLLSFRSCLLSQLTTARNISLKQPSTGDKL